MELEECACREARRSVELKCPYGPREEDFVLRLVQEEGLTASISFSSCPFTPFPCCLPTHTLDLQMQSLPRSISADSKHPSLEEWGFGNFTAQANQDESSPFVMPVSGELPLPRFTRL